MVCNNIIVTYKNNKYNIIINKILTYINTVSFSINFIQVKYLTGLPYTKSKKHCWLTKRHYKLA